jgi:hypothetical protein
MESLARLSPLEVLYEGCAEVASVVVYGFACTTSEVSVPAAIEAVPPAWSRVSVSVQL